MQPKPQYPRLTQKSEVEPEVDLEFRGHANMEAL